MRPHVPPTACCAPSAVEPKVASDWVREPDALCRGACNPPRPEHPSGPASYLYIGRRVIDVKVPLRRLGFLHIDPKCSSFFRPHPMSLGEILMVGSPVRRRLRLHQGPPSRSPPRLACTARRRSPKLKGPRGLRPLLAVAWGSPFCPMAGSEAGRDNL